MRIFNRENGINKLYVQVSDIKMLVLDPETPRSISNVICEVTFDERYDQNDFWCFTKDSDINFIESHDWIVDYREYKDKKISDIKKEINTLKQEEKRLFNIKEERTRSALLDYKALKLEEVVIDKKGIRRIELPLAPDYKGFKLTSNDNTYELNESLNPCKFLIYRKDGKNLSSKDRLRDSFIEMGIKIALYNKVDKNDKVGTYRTIHSFTEDRKYLVTEIEHVSKEERINNNSFVKRFKKIFANKKEL